MSRIALAAVLLFAGRATADDLTVLKPDPDTTPPRKLLHTYLLAECQKHFNTRKAEVEKLKTPAEIADRQTALRAKFIEALGGFPEKTPLNARVVGQLKRDGYRVEKVIYESRPEHHVTANLYIPDGKGPFPGVLMPLGHSLNGKAAEYMQRGAILLVKNGFVALVYDPIGQGERSQLLDPLGNPAIKGSTSEHTMVGVGALLVGRSTGSYRIWDGIRSLDYLASRPEVDPRRLGCTGCSGGGTLTSYLMALDDRILAAAPSCYITTLERLFATIGPQDAEQNITGQVAFGLDHPDYITLRAPKPTLLLAASRDFFDIQGTWNAFREAKRVYSKLGFPERVELVEADAGHGYPKLHREAMARFFSRWLKGIDAVITEPDFPIEKDADLRCTRTGQVLDDLKGKSVFDLNAATATRLANQRASLTRTPEEFRKDVARVLGLAMPVPSARIKVLSRVPKDGGYSVVRQVITGDSGIPIPGVLFAPDKSSVPARVVIFVHDGHRDTLTAAGGPMEQLARAGVPALAIDVRGIGETAPGVPPTGKPDFFGVAVKETFLGLHLNRPLLAQRVYDLLSVVGTQAAGSPAEIEVIGYGAAAPVVLHAAALDPRIKVATLDGGILSWDNVVRTPVSYNQLSNAVPGVLAVYDLPDLAAAIAPRPLTIRNPVDATGKPVTAAAWDATFKPVRAAYDKAGVAAKLKIGAK